MTYSQNIHYSSRHTCLYSFLSYTQGYSFQKPHMIIQLKKNIHIHYHHAYPKTYITTQTLPRVHPLNLIIYQSNHHKRATHSDSTSLKITSLYICTYAWLCTTPNLFVFIHEWTLALGKLLWWVSTHAHKPGSDAEPRAANECMFVCIYVRMYVSMQAYVYANLFIFNFLPQIVNPSLRPLPSLAHVHVSPACMATLYGPDPDWSYWTPLTVMKS